MNLRPDDLSTILNGDTTSESSLNNSLTPPAKVSSTEFEKLYRLFSAAYQPTESRSNVKLWGSALLALMLWVLLISLAWSHFQSTKETAAKRAALPIDATDRQVDLIEKSSDMVNSTASSLYTFLTPVVTAITGYFFVASSSRLHEVPSSQISSPESEP